MEEVNLPSHLIYELEEVKNYRTKYKHNTLVAYNREHVKVVSDSQLLLESSEAPMQNFNNEWTLYPSSEISDVFIFNSGVYTIYKPESRSMLRRWTWADTISVFQLNDISNEYVIKCRADIVAHWDIITSKGDDFLVVLTRDNMVCYHDIKKEKITYEYSLAHCIPGLNLESARIFSVNQHNILVIQVNKTHLVLIDFSHKDIPLLIEFSVEKVLAVHSIVNTPHILLITQKSEIEGVDVAFYTFKMFNESDKSSIQSEDNIVEVPNILEPTLSESLVLDSQYVSALESVLVLVKTHYDTLELKNLKITGVEDIISAKLDKFKDHDLIRGQINITNGYIISDSIYHSSNAEQFSVSVEFFISDSIKLYVHEFTSEDEKFSLKSIAELFFNTLKVPKNISENVSVPKNQDILTVNEINELLFSNQTEEICAEVFATENEEFVHNLAELKVFIDNKRQDLLLIVDSDCSLETFQKARRYIRSLTQIMKAIKERRIIEAECNKAKVHSENYTESDLRDLRSLESELEVLNKLHQRIFYMYLIVKHNIRASFDNQKEVIIKKTETRELFKADRYQKVFDSFTQKYIHDTPLLMKVILKEAGLEQVYPFHSFNELLEFIAKDISIATMDFVMIYLILDILGEKNEEEILMSQLRTLPNWSEYYLYWAADSSYDWCGDASKFTPRLSSGLKEILDSDKQNIEYSNGVLQSLHELGADYHYTMFRSFLFKTFETDSEDYLKSGWISDLNNTKSNTLSVLVYNLCVCENIKQAEILLRKTEKDKTSSSPAFILFAYYLLKQGKLEYLLDLCMSSTQQEVVRSMLRKEEKIIKHFIDPYFFSKDPKAVMEKKYNISRNAFSNKNDELQEKLGSFIEYIDAQNDDHSEPISPKGNFPT